MKRSALVVQTAYLALALALLAGCARQPAPTPQMARVDSIIKASGGDWNRVAPADRDYMIRVIGKGSPISAQMTFNMRAGMRPGGRIHH